jgi:hypothetical protein
LLCEFFFFPCSLELRFFARPHPGPFFGQPGDSFSLDPQHVGQPISDRTQDPDGLKPESGLCALDTFFRAFPSLCDIEPQEQFVVAGREFVFREGRKPRLFVWHEETCHRKKRITCHIDRFDLESYLW